MSALSALPIGLMLAFSAAGQDSRVAVELPPESRHEQERVADGRAQRLAVIYSIADLAVPPGRDARFGTSPESSDWERRLRAERLDALAGAARSYVRPKFLAGLDELRVHDGTTWLVTGTEEHHAWIRSFLELQRDADAPMLHMETVQVRGDAEDLERIGFEGPTAVLEDGARTSQAFAAARDPHNGFDVLSAPRLLVSQATPASMSLLNKVSYVKSFDVVYVHPGPSAIADPVIDVVEEGTVHRMIGVQIEPGLYALDIELVRTEIERPIPTKEVQVTVDSHAPLTISQPTVLTSKLSTTVLLRDGGGVWFRVPDGEREVLTIVRLDLVTPAEAGGATPLPPSPHPVDPTDEAENDEAGNDVRGVEVRAEDAPQEPR